MLFFALGCIHLNLLKGFQLYKFDCLSVIFKLIELTGFSKGFLKFLIALLKYCSVVLCLSFYDQSNQLNQEDT